MAAKVLIDSSVWINFFSKGEDDTLSRLLEEDMICTNDLILTELLPNLMHIEKRELVEGLHALEKLPLNIDWDVLRRYRLLNLSNGVNKVGIPDLIILQQVIEKKITLYSLDKHFKLMQGYLSFDLL